MLMNISLPEFDVYQGTVAPTRFNSWYIDLFSKRKVFYDAPLTFTLFEVTSFLLDNLVRLNKNLHQAWRRIQNPCNLVPLFSGCFKALHLKCLRDSWLLLCLRQFGTTSSRNFENKSYASNQNTTMINIKRLWGLMAYA